MNTTETKKEMVDKEYGYRYTPKDDGSIEVRYGEIKNMLDKKPTSISGNYEGEDGYEEYIDTKFEDFLKKVVIGNTDMFGKEWRLSLRKVKQIIDKVYSENGWDEIYDWEEV